MILIADSGSTTCDWLLVDNSGNRIVKQTTPGINPVMFGVEEIERRIREATDILIHSDKIGEIYFYSAGCGLIANRNLIFEVLKKIFTKGKVEVQSDLVAAVRATAEGPSIVCILGTGSNSCFYDGYKIHLGFDSLGYSVMDEAGGNYFGKQLLRDYFYKKMPPELSIKFSNNFEVDTEKVLLHLYKKPMPAQYLASYAKFIFDVGTDNLYIHNLLEKGFEELVEFQLQLWKNKKELPIHFIGSIAFFGEEILRKVLERQELKVGTIIRAPIDKITTYHLKN